MISRSIVLLPLLKAREVKTLRSVEFSKSIFNKLPHREVQSMSVPMLFETKTKENKTVYISYDNTHKTDKSNIQNHSNFYKQINSINTIESNLFFQTNTAIKSQNSTLNQNMNKTSVFNKSFNIQKNSKPIRSTSDSSPKINNKFENLILQNENTSLTQKSISKHVENFIYKTENHVETRLEKIENKIKHIKQSENIMPELATSMMIKSILPSNKEIQNISEKVYSLVLKKFEREQRRKGNLYA